MPSSDSNFEMGASLNRPISYHDRSGYCSEMYGRYNDNRDIQEMSNITSYRNNYLYYTLIRYITLLHTRR